MKKPITASIIVIIASVISSYCYMVNFADSVASVAGYFLSLVIFPFMVGALIGTAGMTIIGKNIFSEIKAYWWMPAIGAITSLVPVIYVLWAISQPNH